jgi:hypothetical protein
LIEYRAVGCVQELRFGFCVDRLGMVNGARILLDLKTSSKPSRSWPIQTVAYALGLGCFEVRRAVVHMAKDGSLQTARA